VSLGELAMATVLGDFDFERMRAESLLMARADLRSDLLAGRREEFLLLEVYSSRTRRCTQFDLRGETIRK
jgi:hypothetical protein